MKRAAVCGTSVRPATVPALVLCAVLMTWTEAAWAGEEPLAPFPGTSVPGPGFPGTSVSGTSFLGVLEDGGGESAEAAPPALGAGAAGPAVGPSHPGAAGDETAVPDAGAEVPGKAGPGVDAEPSGAAAPDGGMAAKEPATTAGGSRLLRVLAELPIPGAGPAETARHRTLGVSGTSVPGTSVFTAEGCPRALLRRLLAGAAGEADALSALGIEREILTLCRERQEIVAGLLEAEARLSELREAGRAPEPEPQVPASSAAPAPRVEAVGGAPVVEMAAPSPLRAALGAAAVRANEADTRAGDPRTAEPQPAARVSPRYAWFSIIGTAGALRAGVSDGIGVWFVREGDPLPGGATVAVIAGRPPGVRVTGAGESGEATLLPFRARPGAGP